MLLSKLSILLQHILHISAPVLFLLNILSIFSVSFQTSSLVNSLFETKPGHYDKLFGTFNESERLRMLKLAHETFVFAYDSYMEHAFPADELNPIYCSGRGPDIKDR